MNLLDYRMQNFKTFQHFLIFFNQLYSGKLFSVYFSCGIHIIINKKQIAQVSKNKNSGYNLGYTFGKQVPEEGIQFNKYV